MPKKKPVSDDQQDDRASPIFPLRGQTGGIAFLPSESYDTWETMPGDVYNAWMEKVSQLRVCRQPLPEAVAVWLELVLDCVKNFPKNYCIQTLRRLGQRFPRILDIRNDVLKQRDEFAVCAMGPVKLGQQVYSSAHEAIVELAHTFYRQLVPEFINLDYAPKARARYLDRVRADLCKLPESLPEQIREAKALLVRERTLSAKGRGSDPANLEWSKPVAYKALRTAMHISHNTLKARLVDSVDPVVGMIRYKGLKNAKKIQIVVSDLPADLQGMFRRARSQEGN
jgi:hypothetical protein